MMPPSPGLSDLNAAAPDQLTAVLTELSGSAAWARAMVDARPFPDAQALYTTAREVLETQDDDEVIAAVEAHPPIGARGPVSAASAREQSAAAPTDDDVVHRLELGQRRYAEHFGRGFLICATGLTSEQVLAELHRRMGLTPEQDLTTTRDHLVRINALRLDHLLENGTL